MRDDAMHAETGRCVKALPDSLREVVMASYLSVGSIQGVASAMGIDAAGLRSRIEEQAALDEQNHQRAGSGDAEGVSLGAQCAAGGQEARRAEAASPAGKVQRRRRARDLRPVTWLRPAVSVALQFGLTERAVHDRLCQADRAISRMLLERRNGACVKASAHERHGFASVAD
jgi:hypothetical protein